MKLLAIASLLCVALVLGCDGSAEQQQTTTEGGAPDAGLPSTPTPSPDGGTTDAGLPDAGGTVTDAGTQPPPPVATSGDIPCDVGAVLAKCSGCHGTPLAGGATVPLVTYQDLIAPSPIDPSMLVIDRAIVRMQDPQRPMPPTGLLPQADVDALIAWRAQGMPPSTCTANNPPPPPPQSVCTSGKYWTSGNSGSSSMNPGLACIACHSQGDGPAFTAAGTLYPTIREPDLCRGANGTSTYAGASVELIDSTGKTFSLSVNSAGNFYLSKGSATVSFPIRARVTYGGKTREMLTAQASGDCNSCHTEDGTNGAPGRVALP